MKKQKNHTQQQGWGDFEVVEHHQLLPSLTPIEHPAVEIIMESLRQVYSLEPIVFPNIGVNGTNHVFTEILGILCFVVPHAQYDQAKHAPNESMHLEGFRKGIRTAIIIVLEKLAETP